MLQHAKVFFNSSYRGYFYDSLCRLSPSLDRAHRALACFVLDARDFTGEPSQLEHEGRYSVVCPFNAHDVRKEGFLGFVSDDMVRDINQGVCRVFFDNSNERCSPRIIAGVVDAMAARGVVNPRGLAVICQDRGLVGTLPVEVLVHDFFVVRSADVLAREVLPVYWPGDQPRRLFLCLNATPRPLRVLTIAALIRAGLWGPDVPHDFCAVSFPGFNYCKDPGLQLDQLHAQLKQCGCEEPEAITSWLQQNAPFVVDTTPLAGNELADVIDASSYADSISSIVTETECLPGVQRITEKSLKAVAMGHLPIVVGNQRSLALLAEFGFESFAAVVDESYDEEFNLINRVQQSIQVACELRNQITASPHILSEIREIGAANRAWAMYGFASHYARRWTQPILRKLCFVD